MKKTLTTLSLAFITIIGTSAFILKTSTGVQGYSGSPGEGTCSGNGSCHGGGSAVTSTINITSVPAFAQNINSEFEYMPDTLYQITLQFNAAGFTRYGFAAEILNPSGVNSGTLQNQGSGVKFLNAGSRKTATHTTPKTGNSTGTFTFKWKAPSNGENATIYTIGNAVNGNGNTTGDFVIPPTFLDLVPAPPPVTTGIKSVTPFILSHVTFFPNPADEFSTISYDLKGSKLVTIDLIDMKGALVKQLFKEEEVEGNYSQILDLSDITPGVYFVKISANKEKVSQKIITIQ
jgi:hypothetical protein